MATLKPTWASAPTLRSGGAPRSLQLPSPSLGVDLLFAAVVGCVSVLARPAIDRLGDTPYQEFLRLEWLLVSGGKGLHLDSLSLPLPPLVYLGASAAGPDVADKWLPVAINVAILLVLTRFLLSGYPLVIKVPAALLLVASPLLYLLQPRLDVQLYVLLLGIQFLTLRAFRLHATVPRITAVIGVNVLLSLTTYMALPAILASAVYLVIQAERQREVQPAAWRALMWLYVPFSFTGYGLWAVFWAVAGSRVKTSYFIPATFGEASYLHELLNSLGSSLGLPIIALVALMVTSAIFLRQPDASLSRSREQALAWAVITFMGFTFGLVGLQTLAQRLPVQVEVITYSLLLLTPAALATVYEQGRNGFGRLTLPTRMALLATATAVVAVFPMQYLVRPATLDGMLPVDDGRERAARGAAEAFARVDPGERILLDPRFTASFVQAAQIDPRRLLTPFDPGFEQLVPAPPQDVRTIVVTDSLSDAVAGNYPSGRLVDLLPDATLIAAGKTESEAGAAFVRVFRRELLAKPDHDAPPIERDRAVTEQENVILSAVLREMEKRGGLPTRPDGWAYAIDFGNLMVYGAQRGSIDLFRQLSDIVERDYLVTKSNDPNALYTVAWRHRPDRLNEASGTTETLRMVEAYWAAGERWNNDYYRRLAYLMAKAYARHQWSDEYGEGWFIRNYYNYETKEYATNTFLVDYAPDVLRRVAEYMHDPDLLAPAKASAEFVAAAQLESGLFHAMYQPEIRTLYANMSYFSPNGIVQVIDSIEAALGVSELYSPERARMTYEFARQQYLSSPTRAISNQFHMDGSLTGEPENAPAVYAYIVRLGVRLGDSAWPRELIAQKLNTARLYETAPLPVENDYNWFFAWTSSLMALRDYQARGTSEATEPTVAQTELEEGVAEQATPTRPPIEPSPDAPVRRTVTLASVRLRDGASLNAPILEVLPASLSIDVLQGSQHADGFLWLEVRTPDGQAGWAIADALD
jgi:hypothetical protein